MSDIILHGYWRSSAAYRVRIALNLKGVPYAQTSHNLLKGEQRNCDYLAIAPQGLVPALDIGGGVVLTQSPAILEWIEERFPQPPLLPTDPEARAAVRAMAAVIGCDIHPVNNLRILRALKRDMGQEQTAIDAWAARWISEGFDALEVLVSRHGGTYCFGDAPTLADCYLVPQAFNAERIGVDLTQWPRLAAIITHARTHPAFKATHPAEQPDAVPG